jgi:hypothetical protein
MDQSAGEWCTYEQAGERLRVSPAAVRARALRGGWRRMGGNDGKARVLLTQDVVRAAAEQIGRATSAAAYIASISSRERCALPRNLPRHGRPRSAVLAISMASDIGSTTSISSRSRLIMSMSAPASHL